MQNDKDLLDTLKSQNFGDEAIWTIHKFLELNAQPYYFKMTGTDQETGKSGYFISAVEPKMSRNRRPVGYLILLTAAP